MVLLLLPEIFSLYSMTSYQSEDALVLTPQSDDQQMWLQCLKLGLEACISFFTPGFDCPPSSQQQGLSTDCKYNEELASCRFDRSCTPELVEHHWRVISTAILCLSETEETQASVPKQYFNLFTDVRWIQETVLLGNSSCHPAYLSYSVCSTSANCS